MLKPSGKIRYSNHPNYVKVRALDSDMQPVKSNSLALHLQRVQSPRWTYVYRKSRRRTIGATRTMSMRSTRTKIVSLKIKER